MVDMKLFFKLKILKVLNLKRVLVTFKNLKQGLWIKKLGFKFKRQ